MNVQASTQAFDEVVEDVSGGNIKVPRGDYLQTGPFPVVDQGRDHVGGFAEDASCLVRGQGPWIVFGDHTRALKYLDVPFCMGADGIKVLKPRNPDRLDAKFLYHFLSATDVPNAGYSRHFKFLRRLEVPLPPLDEQRRIAAILDKADALRCKRKRVIALFDDFIRSVFLDMFGDPQLAKSNMFRPLSQLVRSIDYGVTASANLNPVGPKFLRITDIQDGAVDWNAVPFCEAPISKLMAASLSTGDIVFARTGATTGKSFLIDCLAEDTVFASYLIRVSAGKNIIPEWLFHFFQTDFYWSYIKRSARGAAQGGGKRHFSWQFARSDYSDRSAKPLLFDR